MDLITLKDQYYRFRSRVVPRPDSPVSVARTQTVQKVNCVKGQATHFPTQVFQIHQWIQTEFIVRRCSIWIKIGHMLSHVTSKFDRWPWKTIRHPFFATSSLAIGQFKLELQSGNAKVGWKWAIFLSQVTLKFEKIWNLFYATSSFAHHFTTIDEFKLEL